jgi:hypothetical protein
MGCIASKSAEFVANEREREEAMLGPPSKTMDASSHAQNLVMLVRPTLQVRLEMMHLDKLQATQMITRQVFNGDDGTMYYVKVQTSLSDWPWIFVKIWEPPLITDVSPVQFKEMKKMKEDYKLVTF